LRVTKIPVGGAISRKVELSNTIPFEVLAENNAEEIFSNRQFKKFNAPPEEADIMVAEVKLLIFLQVSQKKILT